MAKFGSLVWGTPANFNRFRVLASLLYRRNSTEVNQSLQMFGRLLGWYTIYTLAGGGFLPCNGILTCAKFTLRLHLAFSYIPIYWQRYCTALEQWASAKICGVQQRAPPIFGRAAITLGIGPHSSYL